jgi:general secretion pathway protein L
LADALDTTCLMSLLVIALPPRDRTGPAPAEGAAAAPRAPLEFPFVFSADGGQSVTQTGVATIGTLPKAHQHMLVVADADVSWQRVLCPKAPAARMRAALGGVMEELLLDDDEDLHLALAPGSKPGQKCWVAVMNRPWLAATLAQLEGHGREVEKVVCASAPMTPAVGHFSADEGAGEHEITLLMCRKEGVIQLGLAGSLARTLVPPRGESTRWTANPAAAAAAERWLGEGERVTVLSDPERLLAACRAGANLRQFGLAAGPRGLRALRGGWRQFFSPSWRPVRWGVGLLALVNLVGLNAHAWQQERQLLEKRQAMTGLLQSTYPSVRAVIDPALQMRRETERARATAGQVGDADLEALLGAAAVGWPDGQAPTGTLRFESGRLTLAAPNWNEQQQRQFRDRVKGRGYAVEAADGRITLFRDAGERVDGAQRPGAAGATGATGATGAGL